MKSEPWSGRRPHPGPRARAEAPGSYDPGRRGGGAGAHARPRAKAGGKTQRSPGTPLGCASSRYDRDEEARRPRPVRAAPTPSECAAAGTRAAFRRRGGPASSPDFLPAARRGLQVAERDPRVGGGGLCGYAARAPRGAAGARGARQRPGARNPRARPLLGTRVRGRECSANFVAGSAACGRLSPSGKTREGRCAALNVAVTSCARVCGGNAWFRPGIGIEGGGGRAWVLSRPVTRYMSPD